MRVKLIAALLAVLAIPLGMSAAVASAHVLSEAQAYGVADHASEEAYERNGWSEEWGDECNRQTPWRFSCTIEIWSEDEGGPDCWREFDVTSPILGSRLTVENLSRWACDPWPE